MRNPNPNTIKTLWIALAACALLLAAHPLLATVGACTNGETCAGKGADTCSDGDGDTIYQDDSDEVIYAGGGEDDILIAPGSVGGGIDTLCGNQEQDDIEGGTRNDKLRGGGGSGDVCDGGTGPSDTCTSSCEQRPDCEQF